jgi:hypothetical protein
VTALLALGGAGCERLLSRDPFAGCGTVSDAPTRRSYLCSGTVVSVEDRTEPPAAALEAHLERFRQRQIPELKIERIERMIRGKPVPAAALSAAPQGNMLGVRGEAVAVALPGGGARVVACAGAALAVDRFDCGGRMATLLERGPAGPGKSTPPGAAVDGAAAAERARRAAPERSPLLEDADRARKLPPADAAPATAGDGH